MQYIQDGDTYVIYIEQNELIMATLTQFCKDNDIVNAQLSGIGAIKEIKLGAYDIDQQEYVTQDYKGIRVLTSYQGNVLLKDGEPFIHAHIAIGDHNMQVFGGHLFEMKVGAVGEFILHSFNQKTYREIDDNIGLATLNLCKL